MMSLVLLKQQGFTLILVVFLDDSDEVLDLVISILLSYNFENERGNDVGGI